MSAMQVITTVDLIIEEYPYMKTDDFKLCFKNAMKMKYGDGSIIMGWLREYNKERCAVADNQSWNNHKANLSEETNYTSGLSYEEYRNELECRVEEGDEEAVNALRISNEITSYLNKRKNGKQEAEGDNLLEH